MEYKRVGYIQGRENTFSGDILKRTIPVCGQTMVTASPWSFKTSINDINCKIPLAEPMLPTGYVRVSASNVNNGSSTLVFVIRNVA